MSDPSSRIRSDFGIAPLGKKLNVILTFPAKSLFCGRYISDFGIAIQTVWAAFMHFANLAPSPIPDGTSSEITFFPLAFTFSIKESNGALVSPLRPMPNRPSMIRSDSETARSQSDMILIPSFSHASFWILRCSVSFPLSARRIAMSVKPSRKTRRARARASPPLFPPPAMDRTCFAQRISSRMRLYVENAASSISVSDGMPYCS